MKAKEERFRLRNQDKIVGYMRRMLQSTLFYSRDSFWWTGKPIDYDEIDEWTGLIDKNGRYIYEWDILHFKIDPSGKDEKGVVLWEANSKQFGIRSLTDSYFIPLNVDGVQMFKEKQLQVFSYLFLNPDLKDQLGISER